MFKISLLITRLRDSEPPHFHPIFNQVQEVEQQMQATVHSKCNTDYIRKILLYLYVSSRVSEPLNNLSETQKKSMLTLSDEIKWLLCDEICTALLDKDPVTTDTLNYVMAHVNEGISRVTTSCVQDVIKLHFVYASPHSYEKFVEEFANLKLPYSGYKLCKQEDHYYLAKDSIETSVDSREHSGFMQSSLRHSNFAHNLPNGFLNADSHEIYNTSDEHNFKEHISQQSDISSINESGPGTDGGKQAGLIKFMSRYL